MALRNWARIALALTLAAVVAPATQAAPIPVTEFQGNTAPNSIQVFSFAPDTLTFAIGPPPLTTSQDPTTAAGFNATMNEVNGGSIFPGTQAHVGDDAGVFTVHIASYGAITSDGLGGFQQTLVFDATSSGLNPYATMNIQDGVGSSTYAQLGFTAVNGIVRDTASGTHFLEIDHAITYFGQTGPSGPTQYDFSPFAQNGIGTYQLSNTMSTSGSLIAFVDSAATGPTGTYSLLSNGFTAAVVAVPEPMSLTLVCAGLPACFLAIRRRKGQVA